MTTLCNFYKRKSNPYNVAVSADRWDHDGAERTQGTITIDGRVVEWYLGYHDTLSETRIFIDGKEAEIGSALASEIYGALAERHCPETSDARMGADYGDKGCCPVCRARHELAVRDVVQTLNKAGLGIEMAHFHENGVKKQAAQEYYDKQNEDNEPDFIPVPFMVKPNGTIELCLDVISTLLPDDIQEEQREREFKKALEAWADRLHVTFPDIHQWLGGILRLSFDGRVYVSCESKRGLTEKMKQDTIEAGLAVWRDLCPIQGPQQ